MPIPLILHQMWREAELPPRWARLRETWLRHHPGWEHRFWTDATLREFVATTFPDFLTVYDGFPSAVMRSDASRYLLLEHFGGVYADLDMESLQPLDPLIAGERLLLPLEPAPHLESKVVLASGRRRIVGNAWMASEPGHPFWKLVRTELVRRRHFTGPLEGTGPFLLSTVVDGCEQESARPKLLPSATVQPASNLDMEWLQAREPGSPHWYGPDVYALHYWDGTWWRKGQPQTRAYLLTGAEPLMAGVLDEVKAKASAARARFQPLVSCMMITGPRCHLAELAVTMFRRQTYEHRELVVIDDSGLGPPVSIMADDDQGRIRWISVPPRDLPLGALRNLALAEARGDFLCQWDDDDISGPTRLERQVLACYASGADACGLHRLQLWWPARDRIAISSSRIWECALLWRRGAITAYPELRSGEDTPPVLELAGRGHLQMIDAAGLYTYVYHGQNTFSDTHWEGLWRAGSQWLEGRDCRLKLQTMQPTLPLDEYLLALGLPSLRETAPIIKVTPAAPPAPVAEVTADGGAELPRILIATPIKDAAPFLENFFEQLLAMDYPLDKISLAFLESDSRDGTVVQAEALIARHGARLAGARLIRQDFGYRLQGERSVASAQRQRRATLARSRNLLLETALQEEDWVLWIDVDLLRWPPEILHRLLASGHEIVTPHCVRAVAGGQSFDQNTFVFRDPELRDGQEYLLDGIQQPPARLTRRYLDDFQDRDEVRVDAVGGTMLLVKAALHRDGLRFPARPINGLIETEGLAELARQMGVTCWALPRVEIVHP